MSHLTGEDLALLDFEAGWWRHGGSKESAITATFGVQPTRYYQRLNALVDDPRALAARPVLIRRLERIRSRRRRYIS